MSNQTHKLDDIIKPINIDLNKLFSLSYTFDNLKSFMSQLLNNQRIMAKRIEELDSNNIDLRIKNLELDISKFRKEILAMKQNNQLENSQNLSIKLDTNKNIRNEKRIIKKTQKNLKNEESQKKLSTEIEKIENKKEKKNNEAEESEEENDDDSQENSETIIFAVKIGEINEKINKFEEKFETLEEIISHFSKDKQNLGKKITDDIADDKKEDIDLIKLKIKELMKKNEDFKNENDEIKKNLEQISIKVMDFNIFDILDNCKIEGGSIDMSKMLIMNSEKKIFKKFSIIDDKIKKNEEDTYKIHNDFQNVKNQAEVITQNLDDFKNKIKNLVEEVQKADDNNSNLVNEMGNKLNENYKKILTKIDEEKNITKKNIDKLRKQIKSLMNKETENEDNKKDNTNGLSEEDLKLLSDLTKRINENEKQLKIISNNLIDLNKIREDIFKLESELTQKVSHKEFLDLDYKLKLQDTIINNERDLIDKIQDIANKNMKDVSYFGRKLESMNGNLLQIKDDLSILNETKNENKDENNKYIELDTFNDFLKTDLKEKNTLSKNIDDLKKILKELTETISKKVDEEDFKNLEILLNNKLEELKIMCGKKFSDKIDTSKSLKYLDAQIKYILEILSKRIDKSENWLLAKKPVGSYTCASCDSFIGNLKEKGEYVAWNKYPPHKEDKNYRVGNGFSRMLKMLNLDIKSSVNELKENNYESDDEFQRTASGRLYKSPPTEMKYRNTKNGNFINCSMLTNYNKNKALPKISKIIKINKTTDESLLDDGNIVLNTVGNIGNAINSSLLKHDRKESDGKFNLIKNNNKFKEDIEQGQPKIVKVFRKNNK